MRGASRMVLVRSMLAACLSMALQPFKQAYATAHAAPSPPPDIVGGRRSKNRKGSQRPTGAAAIKRASRKLRCARARASKRKA